MDITQGIAFAVGFVVITLICFALRHKQFELTVTMNGEGYVIGMPMSFLVLVIMAVVLGVITILR